MQQGGNSTTVAQPWPPERSEQLFSPGTYQLLALAVATIGVLGLCNNLLVLVLYSRFKGLRTPTNLLLLNISLSHLLVSLFGVTFTFVSCRRRRWVWDKAGCVWDGFNSSLFGIVSIMTLAVLAYERYIRVVHAKVIDFSWSWRAITYIWLYSLAWTGAPLVGWNRYTLEIHGLGCSVDWRSRDPNDVSFVLLFFLSCQAVPVVIIAYCYGHILYAIRLLHCVQDLQTIQVIKILSYEKKVAKMCFLIIATFLICWMPYTVISLLVAYGYGKLITPTVAIIPSFFAKSSTAYNPVIYIFMSRKFRQSLLQLLCFRLLRFQRAFKEKPMVRKEKSIRPGVMSQRAGDKPKKKVTFSSSSVIFIITGDETSQALESTKNNGTELNIIQVKPL
uniref:Opsin-3 n=1 Tax=Geotrypetes seraphini TaxID=260995 RepID=A0A6P8Q577_GEOSA|nr:opsin-3 [Geotrypetes seraphini]